MVHLAVDAATYATEHASPGRHHGRRRDASSRARGIATRSRLQAMTNRPSSEPAQVTIASEAARWDDLSQLLQRGVFCPLAARCSVADFLTGQLGLDPDYVRDQIATVFVDGAVVDDLAVATLRPGSTLTLSAAMPGLVGATLRKGGFYSAMRSEISWKGDDNARQPLDSPPGTIRLKLFNSVMREIGPTLLQRGVLVDRREAASVARAQGTDVTDAPGGTWVSLRVAPR
jgi:hypothetical protein